MSKLKITFRKEMWVDINTYYPSFSAGLRKQIDNAIYKLLGGQETQNSPRKKPLSTEGAADAVILKRTPLQTTRPNSKTAALLSNYKVGVEYLKDDVVKAAANNHGMSASNSIHNLLKRKYFEVVK